LLPESVVQLRAFECFYVSRQALKSLAPRVKVEHDCGRELHFKWTKEKRTSFVSSANYLRG